MTYHAQRTDTRDLDHENRLVLAWTEFWKAFDRLDNGTPTLAEMRFNLEVLEDNGQWPPRGFLSELKKAMS